MERELSASSAHRADDPDAERVARCKAGDRDAFAELVREHQTTVYNIAYRMLRNSDDAEDLAQAAFVRAYTALPGFRGDSSFRTWVCQIVTRLCLDAVRARRHTSVLPDQVSHDSGPDWREGVVDRQLLEEAIAELPPAFRAAIVLRHFEEMSYREIADVLDLPIGTVKTHISRARGLMAKRLAAAFGRKPREG
jgi:RNA polymerase sigma-70 factor (ECF subfamily)